MEDFLEKHSPLALSVLLHAVLLLALWTTWSEPPRRFEPPSLPIMMHVVRPPEPQGGEANAANLTMPQRTSPNPSETPPSPSPLSETQRTSPDADENKQPEATVKIEKPEETPREEPTPEETQPTQRPPLEPTPTPAPASERPAITVALDEKTLEQFRSAVEKTETERKKQTSALMSQLDKIAATDGGGGGPGVKRPYASAGVERGTERKIDMKRYSKSLQERFMARYRVKIQVKLVQGGARQSYVNAVDTDHGTYLNSGGSGYYEVMTLSKELLARMAELEEQELRKRKLDPASSLVRTIFFGLREDETGQVDLFVSQFRAEPIK